MINSWVLIIYKYNNLETIMTVFEVTGDKVAGGNDEPHNQNFYARLKNIETHAKEIGKSLGMSTLDRGLVKTESASYGFRFASTSEEKFDAKGIELEESLSVNTIIEKLG